MQNNEELYKTVHWRSFRTMINTFNKLETEDNLNDYDLTHVICYQTYGLQLQGNNVKFVTPNGGSCFVGNNEYDVFEIPYKDNIKNINGKYLFAIHNTSFDYWIYGRMTVKNNISFEPYGFYDVAINKNQVVVTKKLQNIDTAIGELNYNGGSFDNLGARQRAYNIKPSDVVGKQNGIKNNSKTLKGGEKVKIYKKDK